MCCIISGLFLGNGSVSVGRILMSMFVVIIGNSVVGCLIFCIIFVWILLCVSVVLISGWLFDV